MDADGIPTMGTCWTGGVRRLRPLWAVALGVLALATVFSGRAWATRVHPVRPSLRLHGGKSPFKLAHSAARGIVPRSHAAARSLRSFPKPSALAGSECEASCGSQPLEYHGGEVMHKVKLYLIDWEPPEPSKNGQPGTTFTPLPLGYMATIEEFLQRVAGESGGFNNVYSVDKLYGESTGGEYQAEFGQTLRDEEPYPERKDSSCPLPTATEKFYPPSDQPCISDGASATGEKNYQLIDALFTFLKKHPTLPTGMKAIYFMLVPQGVNSCSGFEEGVAACSTNYYCAYHSAFGIEESPEELTPVVYANMPYDHVEGCETPAEPNNTPADSEINTLSHEDNEAVTDPLGEGWYDYSGNEVADKCTYPYFNPSEDESPSTDAYGPLLNGSSGTSGYNQEIGSGHYLLQREWSNAAGGCVTRAPRASAAFTVSQAATRTLTFNGSPSSTEAGSLDSYRWSFGAGTPSESGESVTHEFPEAGEYEVTLTVENNSGLAASHSQVVDVTNESGGVTTVSDTTTSTSTQTIISTATQTLTTTETTTEVSASPVTTTSTATTSQLATVTATKTVNVFTTTTLTTSALEEPIASYSSSGLAHLLGLPGNGRRLFGLGRIVLGRAQCPPACGIQAKLVAIVRAGSGKKHHLRHIAIGHLKKTVADRGAASIALRLSRKGRRLLHHMRMLHVKLILTVRDRRGAAWRITRKLKLTSGAKAARRRHRARAARRRRHSARAARHRHRAHSARSRH